ncbi:DUF1676 domain containing protein [Asbolus verrucosus]|uniref:DUF1676 domain containing protein n=1 Tax=Asbolus verrucosus TaxID=1661398 RepID=A0A482W0G9_ASBVE|nr:DUF1676 domain containing protein [Asbolus verrucosus]
MYIQCAPKSEMFKCFKIQGLKVIDRALHSTALNILDGVTLVSDSRQARKLATSPFNETKLEKLRSEEIDILIVDTTARFLDSHKFQINISKFAEEGRKKGNKNKMGSGALLWALAIKGSFLAMAYNGIAIMSGTALIVGKIAILLSAILGLKKLASKSNDKTTVEIIKVPTHSETHTHSTSYEDDGHYHRSFDSGDILGRRIEYRRYFPRE